MTKKQRKNLYRILAVLVLFVLLLVLEHGGSFDAWQLPWQALFCLHAVPYLIIGYDVILKACKTIRNGRVFDEHFLMMIATFAAFAIGEYPEALAVMLFYQTGEWFQSYAVGKSRQSVKELMEIAPEYANVMQEDGSFTEEDPEDVAVGAMILIKPGEKIPLDGIVTEGESFLDTAALTGESVPRKAAPGDEVISGCVNGEGTLKVRVTKEYEDSTVARILDLVENASNKKARTEQFITRFARYYTPVVTVGAVLLALLPPLLAGGDWAEWIRRACVFLIVSCPCALVISVPLGFFGGIGAASRNGILVKGSNYLEAVADVKTVVFDKTGTLTKGSFRVTRILPAREAGSETASGTASSATQSDAAWNGAQEELLHLAAQAEAYSNHPIARSIREAYEESKQRSVESMTDETAVSEAAAAAKETDAVKAATMEMVADKDAALETDALKDVAVESAAVADVTEEAGHGVRAFYEGKELLAGNEKLMRAHGIADVSALSAGTQQDAGAAHDTEKGRENTAEKQTATAGTIVHIAYDGLYRGALVISDELKEETPAAIARMKRAGVTKTVMLTGDHRAAAEAVAAEAGIDVVKAELLPGDKVAALEALMSGDAGTSGLNGMAAVFVTADSPEQSNVRKRDKLAFVGDGINDAPVLMRADVGIAMGAMGSDAAIEAADIVLMDDRIGKIATVVDIARKTLSIVKQNIVFAIGVKLLILALGALGFASMWLAVFADVGVAVIAILNSMRMLRCVVSAHG
ncbi:MAG: heavy metal translocating P-type ATPase [Lachnospiraceae bacterium]|nr:heavy metal translocating P-type ATPase [Lachnospiraceae bacterium]